MQKLTFEQYKKKVEGCFIGKAVGGTLGAPYEGKRTTHSLTYYDPVPTEMLPNDDLDLQVVWLEAICENGLPINRKHLAEAWVKHVGYHFDEYGMAMRNINNLIQPPMSGYFNNRFNAGMGAAIRAELWASLAPANPSLAAAFAREDACVDHFSDGVDGTVFIAAVESAAFVESDTETLINIGLEYIPTDCRMAEAIRDTVKWHKQNSDMFAVREQILSKYGTCVWEKGIVNWSDVVINVAFTVLAWLCGNGDFDLSICNACNLGYDTDCTAGIVASIMAIIEPDCIDEKWLKPIGTDVVLSPNIIGMHNKNNIHDFCETINELCLDVQSYYGTGMFSDIKSKHPVFKWTENFKGIQLEKDYNVNESLICLQPVAVTLCYPQGDAVIPGVTTGFTAHIENTSSITLSGNLRLTVPSGFTVSNDSFDINIKAGEGVDIAFDICAPDVDETSYLNILKFSFNLNGMNFAADAGIILGTPWLLKEVDELPDEITIDMFKCANTNYAASFIQNIGHGKKYIAAVDFKLWHFQEAKNLFAAQGVPLKLWIDGELILEHENEYYTPSAHRFECSAVHELRGGWHRAYVAIDNSLCNSDELFFGIANMGGRYWYQQIEWRKPKI